MNLVSHSQTPELMAWWISMYPFSFSTPLRSRLSQSFDFKKRNSINSITKNLRLGQKNCPSSFRLILALLSVILNVIVVIDNLNFHFHFSNYSILSNSLSFSLVLQIILFSLFRELRILISNEILIISSEMVEWNTIIQQSSLFSNNVFVGNSIFVILWINFQPLQNF